MSGSENELNLEELQKYELEILLYFKELCGKYKLRYFITAGTLLGAVRHKGFIPWDDDVDVVMPRKDYDKLAKIMHADNGGVFFYQDGKTDKKYPFGFAKLRSSRCRVYEEALKNVPINDGCYIDIFPLDKCSDNDKTARIFFKLYSFLTVALNKKVNRELYVGYGKKTVKAAFKFILVFPLGFIRAMRTGIQRCMRGKRLCTIGGAHGYPRESYDAEWFNGSVSLEFEGESFAAPSGWRKVLENMYGDYMMPPDESGRSGHFTEVSKGE